MTLGEFPYFREQRRHGCRKSGDAKNRCCGIPAHRDRREFAEATEKLFSLGFVENDKFSGMRVPRHGSKVAGVTLEYRFVSGRLDNREPRISTRHAGTTSSEQFCRAGIEHLQY